MQDDRAKRKTNLKTVGLVMCGSLKEKIPRQSKAYAARASSKILKNPVLLVGCSALKRAKKMTKWSLFVPLQTCFPAFTNPYRWLRAFGAVVEAGCCVGQSAISGISM